MNSDLENPSPYFNEENIENEKTVNTSEVTAPERELATLNQDEPINIENTENINPATNQVIAEKINNEDPYVGILREVIPEDVATRRRIAYNILRSMLATRKQVR
jgi:hypothetical protein